MDSAIAPTTREKPLKFCEKWMLIICAFRKERVKSCFGQLLSLQCAVAGNKISSNMGIQYRSREEEVKM